MTRCIVSFNARLMKKTQAAPPTVPANGISSPQTTSRMSDAPFLLSLPGINIARIPPENNPRTENADKRRFSLHSVGLTRTSPEKKVSRLIFI
jgi:hypothetical protein